MSLPIGMKDRTITNLAILDPINIVIDYEVHGIPSPKEYKL